LVAEQSVRSGQQVLRAVALLLRQRFGIAHTTIQVEVEGCDPDDTYCTLRHAHRDGRAGRELAHRHATRSGRSPPGTARPTARLFAHHRIV
jgi:hypothetical protein